MDLSTIKPDTIDVRITHPGTGEPIGLIIKAVSLQDDRVAVVRRRLQNKALRARNKTTTAETIEENGNELLMAAIVGWEWGGDSDWKGKKLEFTSGNLKIVLTEAPWLAQQIDTALADEAAFFQK